MKREESSTILNIESRLHSKEQVLFDESYKELLQIESGCLFQKEGIQFGFVRKEINKDLEEKTFSAYEDILNTLENRSLYRCWNFVPKINLETDGTENYKLFNAGRRRAFDKHYGNYSTNKMSVATGIDILNNDLIVLFFSGIKNPIHYRNPEQVSAYDYPKIYGKLPPSFARATGTHNKYFISGTASIKNHRTVNVDDIKGQVKTMIDNVKIMLSQNSGKYQQNGIVYLRRTKDIPLVKGMIKKHFPNFSPVYLEANICRKNLLVEMEMTCDLRL